MITSKDTTDYDTLMNGRTFASFIPEMTLSISPYRIRANRQLSLDLVDGPVSGVRLKSARFYDIYFRVLSADVVGVPLTVDVNRRFEYAIISFKSCTVRTSTIAFEDRDHATLKDTPYCDDVKLLRFPDADHITTAENGKWTIYRRVKPATPQTKR